MFRKMFFKNINQIFLQFFPKGIVVEKKAVLQRPPLHGPIRFFRPPARDVVGGIIPWNQDF